MLAVLYSNLTINIIIYYYTFSVFLILSICPFFHFSQNVVPTYMSNSWYYQYLSVIPDLCCLKSLLYLRDHSPTFTAIQATLFYITAQYYLFLTNISGFLILCLVSVFKNYFVFRCHTFCPLLTYLNYRSFLILLYPFRSLHLMRVLSFYN